MSKVELGSLIREITDKTTENNQYEVLTSSQQGIISQDEYFNKQIASKDNTGYKIIRKGQFTYRSMSDTGKFYINRLENKDIGIVSPAYPVFEISSDKLVPEYLQLFFNSACFQDQIIGKSTGSTRLALKYKKLESVVIELPDIESQKLFVKTVEALKQPLERCDKVKRLLDELIIARFVELFGTLDNPAQEFVKKPLKELCNKITDGKHGGCAQEDGTERYFVGAREIYDDEIHYDTAPQINVEEFEKDYKRCNVEIGDFLIVNTGATIGKSAIASDPRTTHTLLQKSVALLKVKQDVLNPVFLKWCYRVNTKMYWVENASAQPNLLLSKINSTVIYVPEMNLQNQFTEFVKQADKSKVVLEKLSKKYAELIEKVMNEHF